MAKWREDVDVDAKEDADDADDIDDERVVLPGGELTRPGEAEAAGVEAPEVRAEVAPEMEAELEPTEEIEDVDSDRTGAGGAWPTMPPTTPPPPLTIIGTALGCW